MAPEVRPKSQKGVKAPVKSKPVTNGVGKPKAPAAIREADSPSGTDDSDDSWGGPTWQGSKWKLNVQPAVETLNIGRKMDWLDATPTFVRQSHHERGEPPPSPPGSPARKSAEPKSPVM